MSKPKPSNPGKGYFTLEVGKSGVITVFFAHTYVEPNGDFQNLTTCGIRMNGKLDTYWGNTLRNPQDPINKSKGRQWAFRRAFMQFAQKYGAKVEGDYLNPKGAKDGVTAKQTQRAQELFDTLRKQMHEAGAW